MGTGERTLEGGGLVPGTKVVKRQVLLFVGVWGRAAAGMFHAKPRSVCPAAGELPINWLGGLLPLGAVISSPRLVLHLFLR